jgi:hypothetical protein
MSNTTNTDSFDDIDAELNEDLASLSDDIDAELAEDQPAKEQSDNLNKLTTAMRALDYTGGFTRSKLAQLAGLVKQEEIDRALKLKGDFPSSDELLGRSGAPKGKLRSAAGFIGDIVIDPSMGAGLVGKLAKPGWKLANAIRHIGRPAGSMTATAGKALYKSGFKELDLAARTAGKGEKAVSDVAWKHKDKLGSYDPRTIRLSDRYNKLMAELKSNRDKIRDAAEEAGAIFDPEKHSKKFIDYIEHLKKDPLTAPTGDDLLKLAGEYAERGKVPISTAEQWKENAMNAARSQYKNPITPNIPLARAHKVRGSEIRHGIVDEIDSVIPGQGSVYDAVNEDLGALLTGSGRMESNVGKAVRSNVFTPVDAMLGTVSTASQGAKAGVEAMAAKKLADVMKFPGPRTSVGYAMDNYGRSALMLPLLKRLGIEQDRSDIWGQIFNQEGLEKDRSKLQR